MFRKTHKQILLVVGLLLYLSVFSIGLYANMTAPSLPGSPIWTEPHWVISEDSNPLKQKDKLVEIAGAKVSFHTLLVDNAYLSSGQEFLQWLDTKNQLYQKLRGGSVEIAVLREGEKLRFEVPITSRSLSLIKNSALLHFPVSFVFLLVGWGTYRRPNSSNQALWFYLLCLSMSLVYLTNVCSLLAQPVLEPKLFAFLNLLNMANFVLGPALLFHFALLMPRDRAPKWVIGLIYVPAIVSVVTLALPAHAILVPLFFLGSLMAIAQGAWAYPTAIERAQMKWVGVGFLLGVGPWFLINGIPLMLTGKRLMTDTLPGACLIFIPIFMAVAIQRYRLFDVGSFLEGTFVYISTIILLVLVDLALLSALGSNVTPNQTYALTLASVLALYGPLRGKISQLVSSLAHRTKVQEIEALNYLKLELESSEFGDVRAALQSTVQKLFAPETFEYADDHGGQAIGACFELRDSPTVLLTISEDITLRCGPLPSPRSYSSQDIELLENLTQHCALTLRNVTLTKQYMAEQNRRLQEREQLLGDLHDGVGSSLASIRLLSQEEHISQLAGDALFELQNFLYDSPEYTLGKRQFCTDVRTYCEQVLDHSTLALEMKSSGDIAGVMSRRRGLSVFRIIREALANALKHSEATRICLFLDFQDRLQISFSDDGQGLDLEATGRGLKGMEKRILALGGEYELKSNHGVEIKITIAYDD